MPNANFRKILIHFSIFNLICAEDQFSFHPETPSPLAGEGGGEGNEDEKN
jgi:hypothetical protein